MTNLPAPLRDPAPMLERALQEWGGHQDLWIFGYGSLIWRPDFDYAERRPAKVHGWHRALKMWSRINRGTPECPGLVFGMLSGGSCRGMVFRIDKAHARQVMINLWQREMPTAVYDPRWLTCQTPQGPVSALAFTLSRKAPTTPASCPTMNTAASLMRPAGATAPRGTTPRLRTTSCESTASMTGLWPG